MYSVMWSEHCSYKSSKVHLRQFAATRTERLLVGMGENAGVVDVGDGLAVTFKVESHNHPSFVEPYQGAATGVGGIVRDILAMGARPIAVMDQLRFGPADAPDTGRVLPGVVAGVGGYGNCLGLPEHRRRGCLRPVVRRKPAGQRAVRRSRARRPAAEVRRDRHRQRRRPARRADRPGRHRRRQRAGVRDLRRGWRPGPPTQRAGRRPVHREDRHRGLSRAVRPRIWWSACRTSAAPA